MTRAEKILTILDTISEETQQEANEYYAFYNEKGLKGDELRAQLATDAAGARAAGREDLATLFDAMLSIGDDEPKGTRKVGRVFTVKGQTFTTTLGDIEALEILKGVKGEFAQSLFQQHQMRGKLSDRQWPWVFKLAEEAKAKQAPVVQTSAAPARPALSFPKIRGMFAHAIESGHKTPRITLDLDQGRIRLSIAGATSKAPGAVQITDGGPFGENQWYGRLEIEGTLTQPRTGTPQWVVEVLQALNDETLAFVLKYGQQTGNCCFCNRGLVTKASVTVGYGPVCAEKFNLPWG